DFQKIVAAHAWLAWHPGGDDHDIRILQLGIFVGALQFRDVAFDWCGLGEVERLALGNAIHHVEQHDLAKLPEPGKMGKRAADLTRADQRNSITRHEHPLSSTPKPDPPEPAQAKGWLNAILSARKVLIVGLTTRDRNWALDEALTENSLATQAGGLTEIDRDVADRIACHHNS